MAADQRYCLECGERNGPPRLDWRARIAAAPAPTPSTEPLADAPAELLSLSLPGPRVAATLILGTLAFGTIIGHVAGPGAPAADAGGRPNLTIVAAAPAPTPAPAATAPPAADPVAPASSADDAPVPDAATGAADDAGVDAASQDAAAPDDSPATADADADAEATPDDQTTTDDEAAGEEDAADTTTSRPQPPVKHVWVIALTGHGFDEAFGPASPAPYLSGALRAKGTLLPWYHAPGHDPAAGGVALLGGKKDEVGPFAATSSTLLDQLTAAGRTWKAYVEGAADGLAPGANPCARPAEQAPRNPLLRFATITQASECASSLAGLEQLAPDTTDAESAPSFSYILPGPAHDGSTSLADADAWLSGVVEPLLASKAYADGGLVVVTFDAGAPDDVEAGGGRTGALLVSPFVAAGGTIGAPYDAFSLLASIEDLFGLERLGYAAKTTLKPFGPKVYAAWTPDDDGS